MANTLFIGKVYHRLGEVTSTNEVASALINASAMQPAAKSRPPEGTVVRADSQSAGRGQFGSNWESAAGQNLTLSVILYPTWLAIDAQFYLSMTVALALSDMLQRILGPESSTAVKVKWPNDLYIGDAKVSGVLIQNTLAGQQWTSAIIGIGLNVNQQVFSAAVKQATSLRLIKGRAFDLDAVADTLFACLEQRYLQLRAGKKADIHGEYEQYLYRRGLSTNFQRPNGAVFSGQIQGIQPDGRLRIETAQGIELFDLKEVTLQPPYRLL